MKKKIDKSLHTRPNPPQAHFENFPHNKYPARSVKVPVPLRWAPEEKNNNNSSF